jgi:hypothetical protein
VFGEETKLFQKKKREREEEERRNKKGKKRDHELNISKQSKRLEKE